MVSLTMPVLGANRRFVGVAGADLSLDRLRDIVRRIYLGLHDETGGAASAASGADYAYLISGAGRVLVHPDTDLMLREGFDGAQESSLPERELIAGGPRGDARVTIGGDHRRLFWSTSDFTGWKLVLNVSEDEALRLLRQLLLHSGLIRLSGLLTMIALVMRVAARVTRLIGRLASAAGELARGDDAAGNVEPLTARPDELGARPRLPVDGGADPRARGAAERGTAISNASSSSAPPSSRARSRSRSTRAIAPKPPTATSTPSSRKRPAYVRSILPDPTMHPLRIDWQYRPSTALGGDAFGYHCDRRRPLRRLPARRLRPRRGRRAALGVGDQRHPLGLARRRRLSAIRRR